MSSPLTAVDNNGKAVDWWFAYKVASESDPAHSSAGDAYLFYDANSSKSAKPKPLSLASGKINQSTSALSQTLAQIYTAKSAASPGLGWFAYNDQNPDIKGSYKNPVSGKVLQAKAQFGSRGHTKGVLAFDLKTNSGFWLVHSVPMFVLPDKNAYPDSGLQMGQSFLCVSLADADTASTIAQLMYKCYQPNVYAASPLPKALAGKKTDFRYLLMSDEVSTPAGTDDASLCGIVPFKSRAGMAFKAIAKNEHWGQKDRPKLDFYNDLVGAALGEDIDVETWQRGTVPTSKDKNSNHKVVNMKSVNLKPLGYDIEWSETVDHAKLAISDKDEKVHWVCVGGMNFNVSQEKRGGGTVAFQCEPLWKALDSIFSTAKEAAPITKAGKPKKKAKAG